MDDKIFRIQILYALKCRCCLQHTQETLEHLMLQSEVATEIWGSLALTLSILFKLGFKEKT